MSRSVLVLSAVLLFAATACGGPPRVWRGGQAQPTSEKTPSSSSTPAAAASPAATVQPGGVAAPDLVVTRVTSTGVTGNWQTLAVSGSLSAEIANKGNAPAAGEFTVTLFEDTNANARFDAGVDTVVGSPTVQRLAAGTTATVSATISGTVMFRQNLVYAFVDSGNAVSEADETNNYANSGGGCERKPSGEFKPVVKWAWTKSKVEPDSLNVINTPAVIDLNADGVPDVVFGSTSGRGGQNVQAGVLRGLRGDNGAELFTVTDPALMINTVGIIAVGDIDLDGKPEIIAFDHTNRRLIAFEHNGAFKWRSPEIERMDYGSGAIALADLDGDGTPEIVVGRQVFNNDGSIRWTGEGGIGGQYPLSLVADIDMDGSPNVVAGNTVYTASGSILWRNPKVRDGYNAVGNFDGDPFPEIVVVSHGQVWLLEHDGAIRWGPVRIPEGGAGGPPTVANFDDDPQVEIGVAGATRYAVFETDGTLKWAAVTRDPSSNRTGSSVFDFEGDGAVEVIYQDETTLRVYRGKDGTVLFAKPLSSSTWHENAIVADVDGDGSAEIVAVANNNSGFGPQRGLYVFRDSLDSWVPTRKIWNQHTYHITNINDDGTIPRKEKNNWETFNNYRQNVLTEGRQAMFAAPDLTASFLRMEPKPGRVALTARIGNAGARPVRAGMPVSFYDGDPSSGGTLLGTTKTTVALAPGEFTDVTLAVPLRTAVTKQIWVVADDKGGLRGVVGECDEKNNAHTVELALQVLPPRLGTLGVVAAEGLTLSAAQIELILDVSGSMKRKIEGRQMMDIAKDVMIQIIKGLPDDAHVALRFYGHRIREGRPGDCQDSELVFPFGKINKAQMLARVQAVQALGTTPIAYSLRQVPRDFGTATGEKMVILVTDGKEECGGSPSAVVSELVARGFQLRLNIVGFALAEEATKREMEQVAKLTNGRFFDAKNAKGLREAIQQSLAVPYEVRDVAGAIVGRGLTGGAPLKLPEGTYTVTISAAGKPITVPNVRVAYNGSTKVELKKEGQEIGVQVIGP